MNEISGFIIKRRDMTLPFEDTARRLQAKKRALTRKRILSDPEYGLPTPKL